MHLAIDPEYKESLVAGKSKGKQDVLSDGTSTLAIGFALARTATMSR
jgi:hypothetical protein